MADPTPGPSRHGKRWGYTPKTSPQKLRILHRVAAKVKEEYSGVVGRRPKFVWLTGLQPSLIDEIVSGDAEEIEIKIREVDRSVIYYELMGMYLNEKIMPTTYQLFIKLYQKIPVLIDLGQFRSFLFKHGFMWKRISKDKCVVIEKPKVVFERYSYLKSIRRHRKEEKAIYFIDELAFDRKGDILTMKQSMSLRNEPQIRLIYVVTQEGVKFKKYIDVDEFNKEVILKWAKETLFKSLGPSVFVINNYKHHNEEILPLPNENSLRKEMIQWLEYFDVPHDPELPKSLLFDLIERYTDISKKIYVIDDLFKKYGHTVLRLPNCIIKLTPATYYFDILRVNMPVLLKMPNDVDPDPEAIMTSINKVIDTVNEKHASEYSEVIIKEEQDIFLQDEALDKILDDLEEINKAASSKDIGLDSDLPSSDSDSNSD